MVPEKLGKSTFTSSAEFIEADKTAENLHDFQEQLKSIKIVKPHENLVINLDLDEPVDEAIRFFRQQEMIDSPHVPSKLYLCESVIGDRQFTDAHVTFTPRIARSGQKSVHGVFFGDLKVHTEQEELNIPVAVKPHNDSANESCLQDYVKNLAVAKMGIYTLKPIGFINGKDHAYSLTELDYTFSTLDSVNWTDYYPNFAENPGMNAIWSQVARQAAMLHSNGSIMHGDLAARNIALSIDGSVFFLDWERGRISMHPPKGAGVSSSLELAFLDLDVLVQSLCVPSDVPLKGGIGVFSGKEGNWWDGFREMFFDEYAAHRIDYASGTKQEAKVKEELENVERELKYSFEMHCSKYGPNDN